MKIERILGILIIVVLITNMVMPSVFAVDLQNADEQLKSNQEENSTEEIKKEQKNNETQPTNKETELEEISFEDDKLKQYMLANYDIDRDGVITDYDMLQLTSISISAYNITSLKGLETAKNIQNMYLYNYNGKDISQIFELKNINELYISGTNFDLTGIGNLENLKILNIYYQYNYQTNNEVDFSPFSELSNSNLEQLSIQAPSSSTQLDIKLLNCTNINSLTLSAPLLNLEELNKFNNLTRLSITDSNIEDISFISNLKQLGYLILSSNKIKDISPLKSLEKLYYLNLTKNPIDIENETNAEVIQFFKDKKVIIEIDDYRESDNIIFEDDIFKQCLLKSSNVDLNNDNEISKYEMEQLTSLYIYASYPDDITSIKEIEYAKNLTTLSLGSTSYKPNTELDLTPISKLSNLKSLSFSTYYKNLIGFEVLEDLTKLEELAISSSYDQTIDLTSLGNYTNLKKLSLNTSNPINNLEEIGKLNNLKELSLSASGQINTYSLDVGIIAKNINLEKLSLSGFISNIQKAFELTNLTDLTLNISEFNSNTYNYSLEGISKLAKLEKFSLRGDLCCIKNIEELVQLQNLKKASINYYWDTYNSSIPSNERKEKEEKMISDFQNLNCDDFRFDTSIRANIGYIECGTEKIIKWEDISQFIKAYLTEGNIFYNKDFKIFKDQYISQNSKDITIDEQNKTITVKGSEPGIQNQSISMKLVYDNGNDSSQNSIMLTWTNTVEGDKTKEIDIPDSNLKQYLLENNDIDNDGKITDNDIINIFSLNIENKNISSLEGLQYATNLNSLSAGYNNISDVTPIINSEKLGICFLNNNIFTDATFLNKAKWIENIDIETFGIQNNFIDFEEGNENYKAIMKIVDDMPEYVYYILDDIYGQNYGNIEDIDKEVIVEDNLKNKLIEKNIDTNNDGKLTRRELYNANYVLNYEVLDLSNSEITDLSGLEYLNCYEINLSANNITNIEPITKNNNISNLNLSNNKITDISGIENCHSISNLNLSNNKIVDISPITNLYKMQEDTGNYSHYGVRIMNINLSYNNIRNVESIVNWKNIGTLNLTNNKISDISALKNYDFNVSEFVDEDYDTWANTSINFDLSNNYIDMTKQGNIDAKKVFDEKGATFIVDNQKAGEPIIKGDMDRNGEITPYDAFLINVIYEEGRTTTSEELQIGDIDQNGELTPYDAYKINVAYENGETLE